MPFGMPGCLRRKALEAVVPVLGVEVVAQLALVGVRVLLIRAAKEALDALPDFAKDIHVCYCCRCCCYCWIEDGGKESRNARNVNVDVQTRLFINVSSR